MRRPRADGRTREWADSLPLNSPEDIGNLPWLGNHYSDMELFSRVERFIAAQSDREIQRRALELQGICGMGIPGPIPDEELDAFLECIRVTGNGTP